MYMNRDSRVDELSSYNEIIAMEPVYAQFKGITSDVDYNLYQKIFIKFYDIWCDRDFDDDKEYYIEKNIYGVISKIILDKKNMMANFGYIWCVVCDIFKSVVIDDYNAKIEMIDNIFNDFIIFSDDYKDKFKNDNEFLESIGIKTEKEILDIPRKNITTHNNQKKLSKLTRRIYTGYEYIELTLLDGKVKRYNLKFYNIEDIKIARNRLYPNIDFTEIDKNEGF